MASSDDAYISSNGGAFNCIQLQTNSGIGVGRREEVRRWGGNIFNYFTKYTW